MKTASFTAQGIEGLLLSMEEFASIPDGVIEEMLDAGSAVAVEAHKKKIQSLGLVDTGALRESIKAHKKSGGAKNGWKRHVLVYPTGKHGAYNRKAKTKEYKNSKHGRTYTVGGDTKDVTNGEVGFIHEFGAPKRGISAKQWMRTANEECADDVVKAELEVYDRYLKSKNL